MPVHGLSAWIIQCNVSCIACSGTRLDGSRPALQYPHEDNGQNNYCR